MTKGGDLKKISTLVPN